MFKLCLSSSVPKVATFLGTNSILFVVGGRRESCSSHWMFLGVAKEMVNCCPVLSVERALNMIDEQNLLISLSPFNISAIVVQKVFERLIKMFAQRKSFTYEKQLCESHTNTPNPRWQLYYLVHYNLVY